MESRVDFFERINSWLNMWDKNFELLKAKSDEIGREGSMNYFYDISQLRSMREKFSRKMTRLDDCGNKPVIDKTYTIRLIAYEMTNSLNTAFSKYMTYSGRTH